MSQEAAPDVAAASARAAPFDLPAPRWARLRQLLDEALDLPASQRNAWMHALPAADADLLPRLRALLAHAESGALTGNLPRIETADFSGASPPAERIGPYRLLRELGSGGMASVWLAERDDMLRARQVALKLPHGAWRWPHLAERLKREREILAALSHPHIARLYDAGVTDDGQPWLALEYVEGQRIDAWADAHAKDTTQRLRLFLQVVQAVAHAHAQLVVHRDLKPANILVDDNDQAKLLDFGIAKLLHDGVTEATALTREAGRAHTPEYASPEQVRGEPLGTASDIYSLGVVLYELLCGQRPPPAGSGATVPLPSVVARSSALHGDLDAIVMKALETDAAQRYSTAQALADDIQRHLDGLPVLARPANAIYLMRRFVARHALVTALSATALLAVLGGAGAALWQAQVAGAQQRRAEAVTIFMADVLREADPYNAGVSKPTVEQLIHQARAKLGNRFADQPALRVQLLTLLANTLIGLSSFDEAETLLQQALVEGRDALGEDDALVLRARLGMSEVYRHRTQIAQLDAELKTLVPALQSSPDIGAPELIQAYQNVAHLAIEQQRPADAVASAQRALDLARAKLPPGDERAVAPALLRAVALNYLKDPARALLASREALDMAIAAWGDKQPHARVLDARGTYGRALGNDNQYRAAAEELKKVVADTSALLGPNVPMVGYYAADVARFELAVDRPQAALPYAERAAAVLEAAGVQDDWTRAVPQVLRGRALVAMRRPQALGVLQAAHTLGVAARGPDSFVAWDSGYHLALAQARGGQIDAALQTLRELGVPPSTAGRGMLFYAHHLRGVVFRLAGDTRAAESEQREALAQTDGRAGHHLRQLQARTELALLALQADDTAPALALGDGMTSTEPSGPVEAERLQAYGLGLRAEGRNDEADAALGRADGYWRQLAADASR
ncbi:MAG: serine/threonine-protein kinase [Burkholderiales bacterium]